MPTEQVSSLSLCRRCQSFNLTDLRAYHHDRDDRERNPPMIINCGEWVRGCQMCLFIREALGIETSDMNATVEIIAEYQDKYQSDKLRDVAKHLILEGIWRLEKYGIRRYFPINLIRIKAGSKKLYLHISTNLHDNQEILKRVKGRPILDPKSDESMSRMSNWLETCLHQHNGCKLGLSGRNINRRKPGLLPKRLIEVGEDEPGKVRCTLSSFIPSAHYAALSYCWGNSDGGLAPVILKKNNSAQFHQELPVGTLPKTIQEAIEVTRRLSIPFLWVDSLCIMQDDEKEWEEEGNRMCEIYEGATVTVVALAARNSSEGLFFDREDIQLPTSNAARSIRGPTLPLALTSKTSVLGHVNITLFSRHQDRFTRKRSWQHELDSSSWNTRSWTLQERLLSRRILYFGKHQLFWECSRGIQDEEGLFNSELCLYDAIHDCFEKDKVTSFIRQDVIFRKLKQPFNGFAPQTRTIHQVYLWRSMVERYSKRHISFQKDKPAALNGIGQAFSRRLKLGDYSFGCFLNSIDMDLYWHPEKKSMGSSVMEGIPSWSWMSFDGSVEFSDHSRRHKSQLKGCRFISVGGEHEFFPEPALERWRPSLELVAPIVSGLKSLHSFTGQDSSRQSKFEVEKYLELWGNFTADPRSRREHRFEPPEGISFLATSMAPTNRAPKDTTHGFHINQQWKLDLRFDDPLNDIIEVCCVILTCKDIGDGFLGFRLLALQRQEGLEQPQLYRRVGTGFGIWFEPVASLDKILLSAEKILLI